ncbi:hypothetical protein [Psychrobacter fjordensis]|uniref:hypothetical protein n=1 Tax=Psychrobacter fjordensis TaxID=664424 RepID=UPI001919A7E9|nr:hypothetical protein [Psychrobacter fjordensis]
MKKLSLLLITLLGSSIVLNGCATTALSDYTKSDNTKDHKKNILSESVIAVGYPNKPIQGYEDAMILAGKNYSFLVQPVVSVDTSSDLFKRIFTQVDLGSLYIDTNPSYSNQDVQKKTQADSNKLVLDVKSDESNQIKNVPANIGLIYAKPINVLKLNEQSQLERFGFECKTAIVAEQPNLICQRAVNIKLTVASAVQNINEVNYKLKQPLNIQLNYKWKTSSNANKFGVVLLPVAMAVDIVTFPVQLLGAGIAVGAIAAAYSQCDSSCF